MKKLWEIDKVGNLIAARHLLRIRSVNDDGVTLVELATAVLFIGILVAIAVLVYRSLPRKLSLSHNLSYLPLAPF